jgi:hypothetical protein
MKIRALPRVGAVEIFARTPMFTERQLAEPIAALAG